MLPCPIIAAGAFVGAPYRLHGRSPEGWDCLGLLGCLRARLFDRPTPSASEIFAEADGLSASRLAELFERELQVRLSAWRPASRTPGVAVLLTIFGRAAHVGLVLSRDGTFIHALDGAGTSIESLDSPRWQGRIRGYFDA